MEHVVKIKSHIKKYSHYFFLPLIILYLSFNIFDGNNGLLSHSRLDSEIASLQSQISKISDSNNLYEIKIISLKQSENNIDLIDEQIRNVLGYGKSNEFIVFFDN